MPRNRRRSNAKLAPRLPGRLALGSAGRRHRDSPDSPVDARSRQAVHFSRLASASSASRNPLEPSNSGRYSPPRSVAVTAATSAVTPARAKLARRGEGQSVILENSLQGQRRDRWFRVQRRYAYVQLHDRRRPRRAAWCLVVVPCFHRRPASLRTLPGERKGHPRFGQVPRRRLLRRPDDPPRCSSGQLLAPWRASQASRRSCCRHRARCSSGRRRTSLKNRSIPAA